jgi:hypothetical protein
MPTATRTTLPKAEHDRHGHQSDRTATDRHIRGTRMSPGTDAGGVAR